MGCQSTATWFCTFCRRLNDHHDLTVDALQVRATTPKSIASNRTKKSSSVSTDSNQLCFQARQCFAKIALFPEPAEFQSWTRTAKMSLQPSLTTLLHHSKVQICEAIPSGPIARSQPQAQIPESASGGNYLQRGISLQPRRHLSHISRRMATRKATPPALASAFHRFCSA